MSLWVLFKLFLLEDNLFFLKADFPFGFHLDYLILAGPVQLCTVKNFNSSMRALGVKNI